jgi:hypothetical protein
MKVSVAASALVLATTGTAWACDQGQQGQGGKNNGDVSSQQLHTNGTKGGDHHGRHHFRRHFRHQRAAYVFRGTWSAADGSVTVTDGNQKVKRAGLVGQSVKLDLTDAKFFVADTDADGSKTAADMKDGDDVIVFAKLPKNAPAGTPYKAKLVFDKTNAPMPDHGAAQKH